MTKETIELIIILTCMIVSVIYFSNATADLIVNYNRKGYMKKWFLMVCGVITLFSIISASIHFLKPFVV